MVLDYFIQGDQKKIKDLRVNFKSFKKKPNWIFNF